MVIPNKYNGYSFDGVRRCFGGGGGGGGGGDGDGSGVGSSGDGPNDVYMPPYNSTPVNTTNPVNPGNVVNPGNLTTPYSNLGVNTQAGYNTLMATQAPGTTGQQKGDLYNTMLGQGFNDSQIRSSADTLFGKQSDSNWSQLAQYAGMQSPTGRPLAGSAQFYQPVYNSAYQNYNTSSPMNVSQYGQQQPAQQPSMFGGQMQGGGYGQYGTNNPFSPYSNSFLNIDPNLNKGTVADKANMYRNAIQSGFGDQQIYNQASGLFGQQTPKDWGYLQGYAMGMTPGLQQQSEQDKIGFYQGARGQGFNDQTIRNAANQMIGNQTQSDWSYLQNKSGYGGGGYGNQFMPQMQNPYSYQPVQQQMQSPFSYQQPSYQPSYQPVQRPYYGGMGNFIPDASLPEGMMGTMGGTGYDPMTGRMDLGTAGGSGQYTPAPPPRSSGPRQAIVGRSSQMRGTPNVMRRAEGGITSLMDDEE
jgi:hypothetical protein